MMQVSPSSGDPDLYIQLSNSSMLNASMTAWDYKSEGDVNVLESITGELCNLGI